MRTIDFADGFESAAQPSYTGDPVSDYDLVTKKYLDDALTDAIATAISEALAAAATVKHFIPTPTVAVDGINNDTYILTDTPFSIDTVIFLVNGIAIPKAKMTLTTFGVQPAVQILDASYIPQIAQDVDCFIIQILTPSAPGTVTNIVNHTVSAGEITAKKFTISPDPVDVLKIVAFMKNSPPLMPGDDFEIINGNEFSWNGKALDGVILSGDKLQLHYN